MSIIITGSIAFDNILHFPGHFSDHIIPEKIKMLNVSFLVDTMKRTKGGCAPNIAYTLALLGERPHIMGTVGEDFGEYRKWLEDFGIDTSLIRVIPGDYTACCYVTTDDDLNQITGFYSGAMGNAHTLSFYDLPVKDIKVAIISPNDPEAMIKFARECRELGIPYIYDPGMQIPRLSPMDLIDGLEGSMFTMVNSYELEMILSRTGLQIGDLVSKTHALFVTKGEAGSYIKTSREEFLIPPVKAREVHDPTGSGDAYRAGIIKGYLSGLEYPVMGRLASLVSSYVVEKCGTAEHRFTVKEIKERFLEIFGDRLSI